MSKCFGKYNTKYCRCKDSLKEYKRLNKELIELKDCYDNAINEFDTASSLKYSRLFVQKSNEFTVYDNAHSCKISHECIKWKYNVTNIRSSKFFIFILLYPILSMMWLICGLYLVSLIFIVSAIIVLKTDYSKKKKIDKALQKVVMEEI